MKLAWLPTSSERPLCYTLVSIAPSRFLTPLSPSHLNNSNFAQTHAGRVFLNFRLDQNSVPIQIVRAAQYSLKTAIEASDVESQEFNLCTRVVRTMQSTGKSEISSWIHDRRCRGTHRTLLSPSWTVFALRYLIQFLIATDPTQSSTDGSRIYTSQEVQLPYSVSVDNLRSLNPQGLHITGIASSSSPGFEL